MSEGGGPPSRTLVVRRGYQPGRSGAPAGQSPRPTWKASVASRASATIVISRVGRSARIRSAIGDLRTRSSARRRPVRDDQTRHAPRLGDRGDAFRDVGRLDHQDLGAEVGRVVEQLPDPAHPLGRGAVIGRGRRRRPPATARAAPRRSRRPVAGRAACAGASSRRTRTRSLTLWIVRVGPAPSSCASTRPATNRSESSRRAVRFDSVKKRSRATRARSSL